MLSCLKSLCFTLCASTASAFRKTKLKLKHPLLLGRDRRHVLPQLHAQTGPQKCRYSCYLVWRNTKFSGPLQRRYAFPKSCVMAAMMFQQCNGQTTAYFYSVTKVTFRLLYWEYLYIKNARYIITLY